MRLPRTTQANTSDREAPRFRTSQMNHNWMFESLSTVDRRLMAAAIMGVGITEVFSPDRFALVARRFGLVAGTSFDLTNGWDSTLEDHKRKAWTRICEDSPYLLIGSHQCT